MAAPLADFSSLLEISFALNVLSGFARTNLHEKIIRYEKEFIDVISEYKEEKDPEIDEKIQKNVAEFFGKLPLISDIITIVIIICAALSIFLLVISSLYSSIALGNLLTLTLVLALIFIPIVTTSAFNLTVKIRYMGAISRLDGYALVLEEKGLHSDGQVSFSRLAERHRGTQLADKIGIFGWGVNRFYVWWSKAIEVDVEIDDEFMRMLRNFREEHGGTNEQAIMVLAKEGYKFQKKFQEKLRENGIEIEFEEAGNLLKIITSDKSNNINNNNGYEFQERLNEAGFDIEPEAVLKALELLIKK